MQTKISKLDLKYEDLVVKLQEYKRTCTTPTFRGFMLSIGITKRHLVMMQDIINSCRDGYKKYSKYYNIIQLLEDYKDELEVKMEEYMIYQLNHPDLKDSVNYNFKNLEFILRASNPQRYTNTLIKISETKNKDTMKILENKSGIKLNNDTN